MGVRLYDPITGRFLSVDPVPGGNDNPYVYPSNPIDGFDVSGAHKSTDKRYRVVAHLYVNCLGKCGFSETVLRVGWENSWTGSGFGLQKILAKHHEMASVEEIQLVLSQPDQVFYQGNGRWVFRKKVTIRCGCGRTHKGWARVAVLYPLQRVRYGREHGLRRMMTERSVSSIISELRALAWTGREPGATLPSAARLHSVESVGTTGWIEIKFVQRRHNQILGVAVNANSLWPSLGETELARKIWIEFLEEPVGDRFDRYPVDEKGVKWIGRFDRSS